MTLSKGPAIERLGPIVVGTVLFLPAGLFLQWWLPGDGPYEVVPLGIAAFVSIAALFLRRSQIRVFEFTGRAGLVIVLLVCGQIFFPSISRRIGAWAELRTLLVEKSHDVERVARELGVTEQTPLPRKLIPVIEARVLNPRPRYEFSFIGKEVHVRIMQGFPPYVGVDYGSGRNCVFELAGMFCIYAD